MFNFAKAVGKAGVGKLSTKPDVKAATLARRAKALEQAVSQLVGDCKTVLKPRNIWKSEVTGKLLHQYYLFKLNHQVLCSSQHVIAWSHI